MPVLWSNNKKHTPLVVIVLYVLLGIVLGTYLLNTVGALPLTTDAVRYDATATHLIETGELLQIGDDKVYPPGYPLFLALLYVFFGHSFTVVYLAQFALVGLIAGASHYLARRHFLVSEPIAAIIGIGVLVWPYMVLHAMLVLSEILGIALMILSLLFAYRFIQQPVVTFLLWAGALLGMATLVRPVTMLLPLWTVLLYTGYSWYVAEKLPTWRTPALYLLAFLLPVFGWAGYQYYAQGTVNGMFSLVPSVVSKALNLTYELAPPEHINSLVEAPTIDTESAPEYDRRTIGDIVASKARNVIFFWNPGAGGYQAQAYIDRYPIVETLIWLYRIGFLVLLATAFLSLLYWREPAVALAWIVILYFWGVHTLLFPYPRYMLPVIPLVLILAGFSLHRFWPLITARCAALKTAVQNKN